MRVSTDGCIIAGILFSVAGLAPTIMGGASPITGIMIRRGAVV
jgi:hypothetical protein